jgi:hypothetical protein
MGFFLKSLNSINYFYYRFLMEIVIVKIYMIS